MSLSLAKRFETSVLLAVQVNREAGGDGSKGARVGVCSRLGRYVHLSPAAILDAIRLLEQPARGHIVETAVQSVGNASR